ncbi:PemK-like protein [Actinomyces bovis]|uniref:PemK-like protein n=1 Tax=Actinomyces bovis TaxID=1658 RepID=A0ABY1VM08_9ACTO|nr:type II toxin-antitoxin system PemK/MazF family toxin [Actinomyces bovis]SPT52527.1 PemK-like protein [Actinomyces bovis]VEG54268.1 PemK-like protein [Actinomyces israelii]
MSLFDRILSFLGRSTKDVATDLLRDKLRDLTGPGAGTKPSGSSSRKESPASSAPSSRGGSRRDGAGSEPRAKARISPQEGAHAGVTVYDVAALGLPAFTYSPAPDGDADPGEVVWTWVPYEEDPSQGKDRPVLVLSRHEAQLVVAQLTSKDHDRDAAQEASWGRYWFDVGSGPWDSRGRRSEMRLDRLLLVDPGAVRREGATMPRTTFEAATRALRQHWA